MKKAVFAFITLQLFANLAFAESFRIVGPDDGFNSIDLSKSFWDSFSEAPKFEGKLSDVLTYQEIDEIYVIRSHLMEAAADNLGNLILVPTDKNRTSEIIQSILVPSKGLLTTLSDTDLELSKKIGVRLTFLVKTKRGDIGLLNNFEGGVSILEYKNRYALFK